MGSSPPVSVGGILITDMVGSTALRSRLGDRRADALRRDHDAMLGAAVASQDGEVLRWTGDGLKARFASASAAVAAAIAMQRAVTRYGQRADAVEPFQIRVGVSVGEVVREDDDDHGICVIEAARLEALASPGEILATDLVQRLGHRRADAAFEAVGTHVLKGLDEPVTVVRVIDTGSDAATRPLPRALSLDRRFPMVGRGRELGVALERWRDTRSGSATALLVAGQPGMGKSRFIAQVADLAHDDGALVLAGVCDADLGAPYQPFAAAFGDASTADDELAAAIAGGSGALGPLFPARRTDRLDDPGPSARFELFEAVVALVDRLAADQPIVLVLEDLQWADRPTVQLLRHLVREADRTRLLLLASYRGEEIGPNHPLRDLLADVHVSSAVARVELGALREPDVAELVAARVAGAASDGVAAFARRVLDESAGSPFFVCELLHHLSTTGQLEQLVGSGGGELPIPDSVRDILAQRLTRLADGAGDLLSTAAVIGLTFDLDLLAAVAGRPPDEVLGVLEDVVHVALINEVDAGRFGFAHAIVRSTLLDGMSATRQALAHRRIAEQIEALRPADHDELARHWLLAGEEDRANASLELAARRDLEALAYESAAEKYQSLVDYQQRGPTRDVGASARAWLGLGLARRALGQPDFITAIEEAGRLGRRVRDADVVADAAIASILPGTYFVTAGATQTGLVELGEDALALVDESDARRPRILSTLAAHLTFDDDRERRRSLIAEAHELARRDGDPELIGTVLVAEYLSLWDPTTFDRRGEIAREVARLARASGDVDLEFFAGFFAAIGAIERCDLAIAREQLGALDAAVVASQNFYFGFLVERLFVSLDLLSRRPGVEAAIDALAEKYADTHADTTGTWALQTGKLAFDAGRMGELVPTIRTLVDESILSSWTAPYALAQLAAGDRAGAAEVLAGFAVPPLDFFWLTSVQATAEVAVGLGDRDRIASLFELLLPYREQLGITASGSLCFGLVAITLGQLAHGLGDHDAAIELLDGAVQRADAMGAPFEQVKSRRVLASARLVAGSPPDEVAELVEVAAELAQRHGFAGEAADLAELAGVGTA